MTLSNAAGATPGSGTKPPTKGVDLDAVGNINGVPVYEFDIDSLKVEDKPWRKPGDFPIQSNLFDTLVTDVVICQS